MPYTRQLAPYRRRSGGANMGSALQFRVGYYDRGLIKAIEDLDTEINDSKQWLAYEIWGYLKSEVIPAAQVQLKKKDPQTWNKTLPPTRQFKASKSIYRRVADSLDAEVMPDGIVRAGSFPIPYGVKGQRQPENTKKTIAQIVKRGMSPFTYRKKGRLTSLPPTVRSSVRYGNLKKAAGVNPYSVMSSLPMSLKGKHPGFTGRKRYDYTAFMENMIRQDFREKWIPRRLEFLGSALGFRSGSV